MKRLSLLLLTLTTLATLSARNYVVCVGVADYPGVSNDLRLSAHDAETMQTLFQKNGNAEVVIYTNGTATVAAVKDAFTRLCQQAGKDDAVIFYFSGHGVPGAFVCYDGFLTYDDVLTALASSDAGKKIILADACFAGKARRTNRQEARADGEVLDDKSVLFFLSSRTNETSIENRRMQNSLFTAYVERGLRGGADTDRNRVVTARELFEFVSHGVTERSRNKQHPVMWGRFSGDMPLMTW